jgi:TolB-like protein
MALDSAPNNAKKGDGSMVEPPSAQAPQSALEAADQAVPSTNVWERLKRHKVLQWTLAYAAAAYTLLHATQMLAESFDWPHLAVRMVTIGLVLGVPMAIVLAWYHGHKARHRVSGPELTIITVLLVIAGSALWALTREHPQAALTGSPLPRTSIAVMPFANMTGDASKEYLGDGMAEEVINTLTKVPGLKVPARTSSFAYKGRNTDIRQIARDLGVGTILEGSVRSAGERIRITAQLINAEDGLHIWSETYDRQFTDIFKLQDELATAIVSALQGTIRASGVAPVNEPPPTQDVEAYRDYLQARSSLGAGKEPLRQSLALYDKAINRDPSFARAFAGRAWVRLSFLLLGYPLPNAIADAQDDAERALALQAGLPEALNVLAMIDTFRGAWIEAATNFQAALAAEPRNVDFIFSQTVYLLDSAGHLRKADGDMTAAFRLAPATIIIVSGLAASKSYLGFDADALRLVNLSVALGDDPSITPTPQIYAHAATRSGHYVEAGEHMVNNLAPALRDAGGTTVIRLVYAALADPSKKPEATRALRDFVHQSDLDISTGKDFLVYFTALGSLDDAYEFANGLLDAAIRSGTIGSAWGPLWLPEMRSFRQDHRFSALVTRLKLPNYWKRYGPPDECDLRGDALACR